MINFEQWSSGVDVLNSEVSTNGFFSYDVSSMSRLVVWRCLAGSVLASSSAGRCDVLGLDVICCELVFDTICCELVYLFTVVYIYFQFCVSVYFDGISWVEMWVTSAVLEVLEDDIWPLSKKFLRYQVDVSRILGYYIMIDHAVDRPFLAVYVVRESKFRVVLPVRCGEPGELLIKDCVRTSRRNCVRTIPEFAYELFINDCV